MITNQEKKVYSDLFDIAKENFEKKGYEMHPRKEAFLSSVECDLKEVDIFKMRKLDKESYFQAIYANLLKRYPDIGAFKILYSNVDKKREEFKIQITEVLKKSDERYLKKISLKNNIYSKSKKKKINIAKKTYSESYNIMYRIYRKLPLTIKNIVKKLFKK